MGNDGTSSVCVDPKRLRIAASRDLEGARAVDKPVPPKYTTPLPQVRYTTPVRYPKYGTLPQCATPSTGTVPVHYPSALPQYRYTTPVRYPSTGTLPHYPSYWGNYPSRSSSAPADFNGHRKPLDCKNLTLGGGGTSERRGANTPLLYIGSE